MKKYEKINLPNSSIGYLFEQVTGAKSLDETKISNQLTKQEIIYSVDGFFKANKKGELELYVYDSANKVGKQKQQHE